MMTASRPVPALAAAGLRAVRRVARALAARRPSGQRGMFTIGVLFWTIFTVVLGGFVVDAGQAITYRQQAGDIAEQAARFAVDDLDQNELRAGRYVLNADYCTKIAELVADSEPRNGDVTVTVLPCQPATTMVIGGVTVPVVTVSVRITYQPALISMIYEGSFSALSSQSAHPVPGP